MDCKSFRILHQQISRNRCAILFQNLQLLFFHIKYHAYYAGRIFCKIISLNREHGSCILHIHNKRMCGTQLTKFLIPSIARKSQLFATLYVDDDVNSICTVHIQSKGWCSTTLIVPGKAILKCKNSAENFKLLSHNNNGFERKIISVTFFCIDYYWHIFELWRIISE